MTVRVGFVGVGRHAFDVLAHAVRAAPSHAIVAVCDIDPTKISRFADTYTSGRGYADYAEMFAQEELDAVIVAVGHEHNFPILEAALETGIDVFVEKTPVRNVAEADALVELQKSTGRHIMVGFNRRFATPYVEAREISQRPEFGGVHLFQSQYHANTYGETAFKLNHMIHHLDLARFLLGEISLTHVQRVRVTDQMIGYTVSFAANGGAIGTIQAGSMLDARYPMERLELVGTGCNLIVDNLAPVRYQPAPGARGRDEVDGGGEWSPSPFRHRHHNLEGYENELVHFIESVRDGIAPSPDIEDARETLRLVASIDQLLY